jgi:hypothetical protein
LPYHVRAIWRHVRLRLGAWADQSSSLSSSYIVDMTGSTGMVIPASMTTQWFFDKKDSISQHIRHSMMLSILSWSFVSARGELLPGIVLATQVYMTRRSFRLYAVSPVRWVFIQVFTLKSSWVRILDFIFLFFFFVLFIVPWTNFVTMNRRWEEF